MHRSNPSRGRVLFDVLCALGMSASFAGAWMQTHATALLGAAGIAALYGLLHLFDLKAPAGSEVEPQRIDFAPEAADIIVPMMAANEPEQVDEPADIAEPVEPSASRSGTGRRTGGSRKGSGRRAKAPKAQKLVEPPAAEEASPPWPVADEPETLEATADEEEFIFPHDDDTSQPQIAPLFEPEPFARMQRRAFGRRGRL